MSHVQDPDPQAARRLAVAPVGAPTSRYLAFFLICGIGAAADLITKSLVFRWRGLPGQNPTWWVIEDLLGIQTAVNIGAVFGVGAGKGLFFATFSVLAGLGVLVWLFWFGAARSWWMTITLGLISGGILGNLYDRLGFWWEPGMPVAWKSGVRDWILMQASDQYRWPNYNIADSLLVVGAMLLVWRSFFPEPEPEPASGPAGRRGWDRRRIREQRGRDDERARHESGE